MSNRRLIIISAVALIVLTVGVMIYNLTTISLTVITSPGDATVYVDGKQMKAYQKRAFKPGVHTIKVERFGFRTAEFKYNLIFDDQLMYRLEPIIKEAFDWRAQKGDPDYDKAVRRYLTGREEKATGYFTNHITKLPKSATGCQLHARADFYNFLLINLSGDVKACNQTAADLEKHLNQSGLKDVYKITFAEVEP